MKVAIIGAGFAGLAAGVKLVDEGHQVEIFEAGEKAGGLAVGFKPQGWDWSLEYFYHHIFANDEAIVKLADRVGWPAFFRRPVTNSFISGKEKQLDSPISLLKFDELSFRSRIWMGAGLALLKVIGNGQFLERFKVVEMLPKLVGREGYEKVWKRLLGAKFGAYIDSVNMAWFWARVYKRTASLGYFEEGFEKLAQKCVEYVEAKGGKVKLKTAVEGLPKGFDKYLITTPAPLVDKIIGAGKVEWPKIDYLWGQTLVLELNQSLMEGYWLNILEKDWPFLVAVEHTNFMDSRHYNDKVVIYLGNYLEEGDKRLKMGEKELLEMFAPYIKRINKKFERKWVNRMWKFQAPFAQPVFPVNYSRQIPEMKVKGSEVYLANMSMVYPWDRGTNYAVELGEKAVEKMLG